VPRPIREQDHLECALSLTFFGSVYHFSRQRMNQRRCEQQPLVKGSPLPGAPGSPVSPVPLGYQFCRPAAPYEQLSRTTCWLHIAKGLEKGQAASVTLLRNRGEGPRATGKKHSYLSKGPPGGIFLLTASRDRLLNAKQVNYDHAMQPATNQVSPSCSTLAFMDQFDYLTQIVWNDTDTWI
jgi:hypothetical protein